MTVPFAHIRTQREPHAPSGTSEGSVALHATISIEANSDSTIEAYLAGLQMFNELFEWRLADYSQKVLDIIIDCFLPAESIPRSLLDKGVAQGTIRSGIFESGDWISRGQWLQLASASSHEVVVDPDQMLADGRIFSLRPGKVDFFPIYGLDGTNGYRPIESLHKTLSILSARMNAWSIAAWFQSENSTLGGIAPKALLALAPDRVLAAAERKPRKRTKSKPRRGSSPPDSC